MASDPRARPASRPLAWILVAYLFLRWMLAVSPGYVYDTAAYKRWAAHAALDGLTQVYRTSDFDYPPLYAYILWPLGKLYGLIAPDALRQFADSGILTLLIKIPPLLFDLAIGVLLHRLLRSWNLAGITAAEPAAGRLRLRWDLLVPALYLLSPAVLFDTGYWGQPDSIHSFFTLAAFLALGAASSRPAHTRWCAAAWSLLALGTLMKPLAAPFFPLLLVLSLAWCGVGPTLLGAAAAAGTALLVLLPFLLTNPVGFLIQRIAGDVGLMPYTSTNAHNLWWLLGAWRNAETAWLGPFTSTQVGLGLFGLLYLVALRRGHVIHRTQKGGLTPPQGLALAAWVGMGFFMLSTHMHENHMFLVPVLVLPLVALDRNPRRPWLWAFAALTAGLLVNLLLHDLAIPSRWPFTLGGESGVLNVHLKRPFFAFELLAIRIGTWWNLALFLYGSWSMLRSRGLLSSFPEGEAEARS